MPILTVTDIIFKINAAIPGKISKVKLIIYRKLSSVRYIYYKKNK